MRFALPLMALLAAATACGGSSPTEDRNPGPELERDLAAAFQTEELEYVLRRRPSVDGWSVDVPFTFTNPTPEEVNLLRPCGGWGPLALLKRETADGWKGVLSHVAVPDCWDVPVSVPPGASYSGVARFIGARPGSALHPQFVTSELDGIYRIRWTEVVHTFDFDDPLAELLPEEARVSNRFRLTRQP